MSKTALAKSGLSSRATHVLFQHEIYYMEELCGVTLQEISSWNAVGPKIFEEIRDLKKNLENSKNIEDNTNKEISDSKRIGEENYIRKPLYTFTDFQIEELSRYDMDKLGLSTRAYNCLFRAKIKTLKDVFSIIEEDFVGVHNVGTKTKAEIIGAFDKWISENFFKNIDNNLIKKLSYEQIRFLQQMQKVIEPISKLSITDLIEIIVNANLFDSIISDGGSEVRKEHYRMLLNVPSLQKGIERVFLNVAPQGIIAVIELHTVLEKEMENFLVEALADKLLDGSICKRMGAYCVLKRPKTVSFLQMQQEAADDRSFSIVAERLHGKTLKDIALSYGFTRERARQILNKKLRTLPMMFEEIYADPFTYFHFTKDEFLRAFPDTDAVGYEYLSLKYKKGEHTLTEENIQSYDGVFKKELLQCAEIENKRSKRKNLTKEQAILNVLIKNKERALSLDEFVEAYEDYAGHQNYPIDCLQINKRTLQNYLRSVGHVVFDASSRMRYCMADAEVIWKSIYFLSYNNSVISAELLFKDYRELMQAQDIHDGYELFCVLKTSKKNADMAHWNKSSQDISFRRIPIIIIGKGNEEKQAIKLLWMISPVSSKDYFAAYEERYGVRKETAPGNPYITGPISKYYVNGQYNIDVPAINKYDIPRLVQALEKKALWFMEELEHTFAVSCPHTSGRALNVATMRQIGYILNSTYAFKASYGTMVGYLDEEVFSKKIVDIALLERKLLSLGIFASTLTQKRKNLEYLDVAPKILMSFDGVEQRYGISKEEVKMLRDCVL